MTKDNFTVSQNENGSGKSEFERHLRRRRRGLMQIIEQPGCHERHSNMVPPECFFAICITLMNLHLKVLWSTIF